MPSLLPFPLGYGRVFRASLRGHRGSFTVSACHIETVNDQLKNVSQIEHSRHRSVTNFLVNLVAGLIAYTYQAKKSSPHIRMPQDDSLPIVAL
jgi:DDE family transposase